MQKNTRAILVLLLVSAAAAYWTYTNSVQNIDWTGTDQKTQLNEDLTAEEAEAKSWVGKAAPDFTLQDQLGNSIALSDYKGKVVLVHFWATWCPPCVEELPHLLKLAQWAEKNQSLVVLAVSEDENWQKINSFLSQNKIGKRGKLPISVLLDTKSIGSEKYNCTKYPETFLIGKNSTIIKKFIGAQNWDSQEMKKWLVQNF